jgi:hypothetical protein
MAPHINFCINGAESSESRPGTFTPWEEASCKGKGHPRTGHEGPEGLKRYSSTLSLTFRNRTSYI